MDFYEEIAHRAIVAKKAAEGETFEVERGKQVQLPLWPNAIRASPSVVLRSALFRVTSKHSKASLQQCVASWPGVVIKYTGLPLCQTDLDVWLQFLEMVKRDGPVVVTTAYGMLKALGRRRGGNDIRWLNRTLAKLGSAYVEIVFEGMSAPYSGTLLSAVEPIPGTKYGYKLYFDEKLVRLFEEGCTWIDWGVRRQLKGDLTKWLHGFILSHNATAERPSKIKLSILQDLSGSEQSAIRNFRLAARRAMAQLEQRSVVMSWRLEKDVLSFARPPHRRSRGQKSLPSAKTRS